MIRRALLIAAAAVALSTAGAMAFTPGLARTGRAWSRGIRTAFGITRIPRSVDGAHATTGAFLEQADDMQGAFCPVRRTADDSTVLGPEGPDARMSTDPRARATVDSSAVASGETLLAPAPTLCRAGSASPLMQSTDGR